MSLEARLVNLAATARKLVEQGMVRGTAGNVSLRWEDACYISPTGSQLDRLGAADFVSLRLDGSNTWQLQRASIEHALHLACYRARPDAKTVFLLQPSHCIAAGCAGLSIRALTPYFYQCLGEEVPLLPYMAPTSQALADAVGQLIAGHDAVLLQNRGLVVVAASTDEAYANSLLIEDAARIVLMARAAGSANYFLTRQQIDELEETSDRYRRKVAA